jgi:hypothetical protein
VRAPARHRAPSQRCSGRPAAEQFESIVYPVAFAGQADVHHDQSRFADRGGRLGALMGVDLFPSRGCDTVKPEKTADRPPPGTFAGV